MHCVSYLFCRTAPKRGETRGSPRLGVLKPGFHHLVGGGRDRRRYESASLAVDADSLTGAVRLYERVGFALDTTWITYSKQIG